MKKLIAVLILMGIGLRIVVVTGAEDKAQNYIIDAADEGSRTAAVIIETLGWSGELNKLETLADTLPEEGAEELILPATEDGTELRISERFNNKYNDNKAATDTANEENNFVPTPQEIRSTTIGGGLNLNNDTGFSPHVSELMSSPLSLRLPTEGPQILIVHTHGSEAYTPEPWEDYNLTDTARTEDKEYNVIRVGDELTQCLENYGLNVIHDRELYDYPSYTGSYGRSQAAIENYLVEYPNIGIVIDLHRDALGGEDVIYKTVADVQGEASSQVMMLVGTGENGLSHPNWQENLKLALYLQGAAESSYPSLMRTIALKPERYNQHLTTGSFILEVGTNGNSLPEALTAVRLYADSIAPTFLELVS